MNTLLIQSALDYAERGFSVIPVEPRGKKPLVAWEQYQTQPAPADEIKKLFLTPGANVAIVTGKISGLVVIDIDTEGAKEKLKAIVGEYDLDRVPRSRTGRAGSYFLRTLEHRSKTERACCPAWTCAVTVGMWSYRPRFTLTGSSTNGRFP